MFWYESNPTDNLLCKSLMQMEWKIKSYNWMLVEVKT